MSSINDAKILYLPKIEDPRGNLTVIEQLNHIPFEIKKVYIVSDVSDDERAFYCSGEAFVVALKGMVDVDVINEGTKRTLTLDRLHHGLYVPNAIDIIIHSKDASLLLLFAQDKDVDEVCISLDSRVDYPVKRVFYTYDVPDGEDRGAHAHKECHQYIVAACGAFDVTLDNGKEKRSTRLSKPGEGIHVPPGVWASEENFTTGGICLVLASYEYNENDYIRDYDDFIKYVNNKNSK